MSLDQKLTDLTSLIPKNEPKRTTALVRIVPLQSDVIIGEKHERTNGADSEDAIVRENLDNAKIIVVEFESGNTTWDQRSTETRFMQMAEMHAKEYNKPLYILDTMIEPVTKDDVHAALQEHPVNPDEPIGIDEWDRAKGYMYALEVVHNSVYTEKSFSEAPQSTNFEDEEEISPQFSFKAIDILRLYLDAQKQAVASINDIAAKNQTQATIEALETYMKISVKDELSDSSDAITFLNELQTLGFVYKTMFAALKDRLYSKIVSELKQKHSSDSLAIVVGDRHVPGIREGLLSLDQSSHTNWLTLLHFGETKYREKIKHISGIIKVI